MKKFVFISNGEPVSTIIPSDGEDISNGVDLFEVPFDLQDEYIYSHVYFDNGVLKYRPQKPGQFFSWAPVLNEWLPNLDAARASKLQQVSTELNARLYLPCNGFDADEISRERISGMIARLQRGDGLPTGWMGWRDADNNMHWAADDAATVLANLCTLSRAIEDREQALLVAGWTHKANIAALEDIDAILAYDVTANWPT